MFVGPPSPPSAAALLAAPADLYRSAEEAEAAGDLVRARDLYAHFVERYPRSPLLPGALVALAWVEIDLGRYDSALARVAALERAAPPGTVDDMILFARAVALRGKGNLRAAEEDLRRLLERHPGSRLVPDAEYLLGQVLLDRGRAGEAEARLSTYLGGETGPLADAARAARAAARARLGRFDEALADWEGVAGETAALQRALILERLGREAEARAAFAAYLDSWPRGMGALRAHAGIASAAARAGETAAAALHYEALLAAPGGARSFWAVEALRHLAFHGAPAGRRTRLEALARDHATTVEGVEAIEALAVEALEAGRSPEATERIAALALASPERFRAGGWGRRLAAAFLAMGDDRAALSALRAWLALDLAPADRLSGALLLAAMGETAAAEGHLLAVVRSGETAAAEPALGLLARLRREAGDVAGAEAAERTAPLPPPPPAAPAETRPVEPPPPPLPAPAPLPTRLRLHVEAAAHDLGGSDRLLARAVDSLLRLAFPSAPDVVVVPPAAVRRLDEVYLRGRTDLPPDAVGADVVALPALAVEGGRYVLTVRLLWLGRPAPARRVPVRFEIPRDAARGAWGPAAEALLEAIRIEARL